jgi:hypothetical protein
MGIKSSKKILLITSIFIFFQGCGTNNARNKPPESFSFTAEQAEESRLNTARIARIDEENAHKKKMKAVDVEIHRAEADVRRIKALADLERAKPDTVIIDKSRSVHLH